MGFFSSIGNAFKSVTSKVGNLVSGATKLFNPIVDPISNLWGKVAPIAEPILSYFGTEDQNQFNSAQAARAMAFSADQATQQRAFQERMSNTAYQRAMQDMREAGLNPILAYQQGGASTPSGAMGSGAQGQGQNSLQNAVNSAQAARIQRQQWFNLQAQTDQIDTMTNKILQETKTERENTAITKLKKDALAETIKVIKKQANIKDENSWLLYLRALTEALGFSSSTGASISVKGGK